MKPWLRVAAWQVRVAVAELPYETKPKGCDRCM